MAKSTGAAKKSGSKRQSGSKRKAGSKKTSGSRGRAAKRELIDTRADKRYVRRGSRGKFKESDDVGSSLTADRRKKARTKVKSGQGDKGDR